MDDTLTTYDGICDEFTPVDVKAEDLDLIEVDGRWYSEEDARVVLRAEEMQDDI